MGDWCHLTSRTLRSMHMAPPAAWLSLAAHVLPQAVLFAHMWPKGIQPLNSPLANRLPPLEQASSLHSSWQNLHVYLMVSKWEVYIYSLRARAALVVCGESCLHTRSRTCVWNHCEESSAAIFPLLGNSTRFAQTYQDSPHVCQGDISCPHTYVLDHCYTHF